MKKKGQGDSGGKVVVNNQYESDGNRVSCKKDRIRKTNVKAFNEVH